MKPGGELGAGALSDLRVVEVARYISGPYCAMFLADLGASVTKVETGDGDPSRREGPWFGSQSLYFTQMNRNKRLIRLDVRDDADRRRLNELVQHADIVIENYRPSAAEGIGLDWPSVSRLNPRAILVAISGFGFYAADRDRGAFDEVIQAISGLAFVNGEDDGRPMLMGMHPVDAMAGVLAAFSALAAVNQRHRTGRGQLDEVCLLDAALALLHMLVPASLTSGDSPTRTGNADRTSAPANAYRASDGWVYIHAGGPAFWERAMAAIGQHAALSDPRFKDEEARVDNRGAADEIFTQWAANRTVNDIESVLNAAGVLVSPVNTLVEALRHPTISIGDRVAELRTPAGASFPTLLAPVHLSDSPSRLTIDEFDTEGRPSEH